jgi:hypothetical protein
VTFASAAAAQKALGMNGEELTKREMKV